MSDKNNTIEPLLLTRQQAGRKLSISLRSIDQLIHDGALPTVRFSKRCVRIPEPALREYIEQLTTGGVAR